MPYACEFSLLYNALYAGSSDGITLIKNKQNEIDLFVTLAVYSRGIICIMQLL